MKHIAILLTDYGVECSCGASLDSIQEWGEHRAAEAWEQGCVAGEVDAHPMSMSDALPINPYRERENPDE